jgi:hypothetical protein
MCLTVPIDLRIKISYPFEKAIFANIGAQHCAPVRVILKAGLKLRY